MINQDIFYKRFGVRTPQQLLMPRVPMLKDFSFPRDSLLHYVTTDGVEVGPKTDDYLFRDLDKRIFVEHLLDLRAFEGNPRKLTVPLKPYVREYHIRNKRFRMTEDAAVSPTDENSLVVVSGALIAQAYRYTRSLYTQYYTWFNINSTAWVRAKEIAAASRRTQFFFYGLPQVLPSLARLNMGAEKAMNANTIKYFTSAEALGVLELWKWIHPTTRATSMIGDMPLENAYHINIVFHDAGRWLMFNLGMMQSWILAKGETARDDQKYKVDPDQMRKRFLRMLMTLMESRTAKLGDEIDADAMDATDGGQDVEGKTLGEREQELLASLDQDLNQLETIEQKVVDAQLPTEAEQEAQAAASASKAPPPSSSNGEINVKDFDVLVTAQERIKNQCDELAEKGLITAAEYRRFLKHLETSQAVRSPVAGVSLQDFIKIPPADVLIQAPNTIGDIITVPDKSMLQSTVADFNAKYVEKVMPKDIAAAVSSIQRAGMILNDYDVEQVEDIMGSYEMHTFRVTPIVGAPSTMRFKLPKVDENGEYMTGGTKYRMRTQRGD